MLKKIALAAFAFVAVATIAAAQQWPNVPIIGGASYCSATGNAGVCTNTVPAGPVSLTGTETVPVDTNLAAGQNPQTAKVSIAAFGGGIQNVVPLTGASVAVNTGVNKLFVNPAGTIAALTVTLPVAANILDGQEFYLNSSQVVTALTLTAGTGTTLGTTTTALAVNTPIRYTYMKATLVWVKG